MRRATGSTGRSCRDPQPESPLCPPDVPAPDARAADRLKEALDLPAEARAALAGSLLDSLDTTVDENAEEAWREEIHCRLEEIDRGAIALIPWRTAQRTLRSRFQP